MTNDARQTQHDHANIPSFEGKSSVAKLLSFPPWALSKDALKDNRHAPYRAPFLKRLPFGLPRFLRAYTLWQEFRSFLQRTETRLTAGKKLGIDMGPEWELDICGNLRLCNRTQIRIQDTEKAFVNRPWATILDYQLFLVGWDAGVRFGLRSRDSYTEQPSSSTLESA